MGDWYVSNFVSSYPRGSDRNFSSESRLSALIASTQFTWHAVRGLIYRVFRPSSLRALIDSRTAD